jgi:hypothetical protein
MREAKTDASCFEEIRPAGNLASETVHLLDSTQRCRADSYRHRIRTKLFTGLMEAAAAGIERKQLYH